MNVSDHMLTNYGRHKSESAWQCTIPFYFIEMKLNMSALLQILTKYCYVCIFQLIRLHNRVKSRLSQIRLDEAMIEAYTAEGWKGARYMIIIILMCVVCFTHRVFVCM